MTDAGAVRLFSGRSGAMLRIHRGAADREQCGYTVAAIGDLDGDGVGDYLIGYPFASGNDGRVHLYSGASGNLLLQILGENSELLGYSAAGARDVNADGHPDYLLVLKPPATGPYGSTVLYSGTNATSMGRGCPGGSALACNRPVLGTSVQLSGSGAPALAAGSVFFSPIPMLPSPLGNGCTLYLDPAEIFAEAEVQADAAGSFGRTLAIPLDPWMAGVGLAMQAALQDPAMPGSWEFSPGLYATLDPH